MSAQGAGSAWIGKDLAGTSVGLSTDGRCLTETLRNLVEGVGSSKPMPPSAVDKVRRDATELIEQIVRIYEQKVAKGEVGRTGSCRASAQKPAELGPTGLLYGRVQSGKTAAMIALSAAALDNGFRVVVVLTSDNVKLVEQTARRFEALYNPLVRATTSPDAWQGDVEHIGKNISKHGVVLISAKNSCHLAMLVEYLDQIGACDFPALILDDEADQATLDTATAARSSNTSRKVVPASAIHRRTVTNDMPDEEGESIRERLRHHVFLQVTATPYALLLQNSEHPLRPRFTRLLEPGEGYTGGEAFFSCAHVDRGLPPLVFVDEGEAAEIQKSEIAPEGLRRALTFFMVAASAQVIRDPKFRGQGQNFLCHTSQKKEEHARAAELIRSFLGQVGDDLESATANETLRRMEWAHSQLQSTLSSCPDLREIVEAAKRRLPRRQVVIVNSNADPVAFGNEWNAIIGGNILGRGLTIDNLLVTYYLRRAKISQMDTVLQHARMFGYRGPLMPYTRVFLPESLAFRFNVIHQAEDRLRSLLATEDARAAVPVQIAPDLRATRRNVLDTGSLGAYAGGEQVYPVAPALPQEGDGRAMTKLLESRFGDPWSLAAGKFHPADIDVLCALVNEAPYPEEDAGTWDRDALQRVLASVKGDFSNGAAVYFREMERRKARLATGAASGAEIEKALAMHVPVLFLFWDAGKHIGEGGFWFPTLVLPDSMPTHVFNVQ